MKFIREHAKEPFFAYLPYTPPHGNFDIPDSDPAWALYKDKPWPEPARRYAAMVTMVDRQVGEVLALLKELGIDENTLVFFSGDNGGADYFTSAEHPRGVHSANKNPQTGVEYRGKKGTLYEGGLRVPFIARWPGKIAPGRVSDHLGYFPDVLPTIAEVTGAKAPADLDGISLVPELIGEAAAGRAQQQHEYLYWEISGWTAIRQGNWRAVKPPKSREVGTLRSGHRSERIQGPRRRAIPTSSPSSPRWPPRRTSRSAKAPSPAPTATSATAARSSANKMTPRQRSQRSRARREEEKHEAKTVGGPSRSRVGWDSVPTRSGRSPNLRKK